MSAPHYFDYCSFVVKFESISVNLTTLLYCFKVLVFVANLGPMRFHMNFRVFFCRKSLRFCSNLLITLDSMDILTTLSSSP